MDICHTCAVAKNKQKELLEQFESIFDIAGELETFCKKCLVSGDCSYNKFDSASGALSAIIIDNRCSNCKNEVLLPKYAKYCSNCGAKFNK